MGATAVTDLPRTLNEQEQDDLYRMMRLTRPGRPHTVNLSDLQQHRWVMSQLEFAGYTQDNAPQLFLEVADVTMAHLMEPPADTTLLQHTDPTHEWVDANILLTLGNDPTGPHYNTTALSSIVGGTDMTLMILNLYDLERNTHFGHNSIQTFNEGEYQTLTTQGTASEDTDLVQAAYLVMYQKRGGPVIIQSTYELSTIVPMSPPVVTNPVHRPGAAHPPGYIAVALNRPRENQPDADYWYSNDGQTAAQLQITGNVRYNSPIVPLDDTNYFASLYLVKRNGSGGGIDVKALLGDSYLTFLRVAYDTLSWDFDPAQFGPLDPWVAGDVIDLVLNLQVTTEGQPGTLIPITVTSCEGAQNDTNTTKIDPLQFFTSCLAGDTLISLADGSEVPIEQIKQRGGHVLAGSDGRTLLISANIVHTRNVPLLTLTTDQGHKLRLTPEHPVVTSRGPVVAVELQVGDEVVTRDGSARLTDIGSEAYEGLTYNLCLAEEGKEHEPVGGDWRTMFANGILVGDYWMQEERYQEFKKRKDTVLASVPAKWHQDYLNSLAD